MRPRKRFRRTTHAKWTEVLSFAPAGIQVMIDDAVSGSRLERERTSNEIGGGVGSDWALGGSVGRSDPLSRQLDELLCQLLLHALWQVDTDKFPAPPNKAKVHSKLLISCPIRR